MKSFQWLRKKVVAYPWWALFVITLGLWLFPQTYRIIRIFFIISLPTLCVSGILLLRKRKVLALALLSACIALVIFLCIPGSQGNPARLRNAYVGALERYEGTLYVWGGENRIGIDCSGLVRNGLIDANLRLGISSLNPRPIRDALTLWWNDCSARALRDGYKEFTTPLFKADSINSITNNMLAAGDIATTTDGVHVLAYLGNSRWIQADPGVMKTIIASTPSDNIWFTVPIHVRRWTQLTEAPNN